VSQEQMLGFVVTATVHLLQTVATRQGQDP
jgi:hypothetical protein